MKEQEWSEYEAFEKLILEREYSELSAQEQQLVAQFVESAQEYAALRTSGLEMKRWFAENAITDSSDKTLTELKRELKRKYQPATMYRWKVAFGYAMVAFLFGVGGWWLGQSNEPITLTNIEKILVHDTVFVASKPDTIFSEKIVYRDRPPVILTTGSVPVESQKSTRGVSMKEKEDLDKLLVSGSE